MSALFVWAVCAGDPAGADDTVGVAQVLDGDSLRLVDGRELRLIGVNAPEFGKDGRPDEPLARAARDFLTGLVAGKRLRIDFDAQRQDRYRRSLAHAFLLDDASVQSALLRAGMAVAVAIPPNLSHLDEYLRAEAEARHAGRGVWNHSYFKPRAAAQLGTSDTGFRFIAGRVQRIGQSRDSIYLDLAEHVSAVVPRKDWHYFGGDPKRFAGKHIVVRGWLATSTNGLRLRLSHPLMLEVVD